MPEPTRYRALIVDWGGVLTTPLHETMGAFTAGDDIDPADFAAVMRDWLGSRAGAQASINPVHALETGSMSVPDFEAELAARLRTRSGDPVTADGLLTRMFAGFAPEVDMFDVLRAARTHGLKVGLLSNSWGMDYPRDGWDGLFDDTVISGEVGLRKPDPAVYRLAAERLGVEPTTCVFVDDLPPNVRGAASVGMVGVLHTSVTATVEELRVVTGLDFAARAG